MTNDTPRHSLTGGFGRPGYTPSVPLTGDFTAAVTGFFGGVVHLERSLDNGSTWSVRALDDGTPASFTSSAHVRLNEQQPGVLYRLNGLNLQGAAEYRLEDHVTN